MAPIFEDARRRGGGVLLVSNLYNTQMGANLAVESFVKDYNKRVWCSNLCGPLTWTREGKLELFWGTRHLFLSFLVTLSWFQKRGLAPNA